MTQVVVRPSSLRDVDAFEQNAAVAIRRLRSALSALIGAIPGVGELRKAADLQRALGIGNTLAWQVYKLAHATDPLTEASSVPGAAGMKRLFNAAGEHGVPAEHIEASAAASKEFDELVKVHAGNRAAFDSMISGLTDEGSQLADAQQKRAAFRANSHLWGVQAKAQLGCYMYQPAADDPAMIDAAGIRGLLQLRRLRRDVSWVITSTRTSDDDGVVRRDVAIEPLDPTVEASPGFALLQEFCSRPLPALRRIHHESGVISVELAGNSVGNKSAVTCLLGSIFRSFSPRYRDEHNQAVISQAKVQTPCEVLLLDVLVHEELFRSASPEVFVYGYQRDIDPHPEARKCDLLALRESVVYLGKGPSVMHTPDVPRYSEMIHYAFDRLGWDGARFDVYRCRVEYPVMPSSVVVRFDLPEKP